jgi:hypothetical protein
VSPSHRPTLHEATDVSRMSLGKVRESSKSIYLLVTIARGSVSSIEMMLLALFFVFVIHFLFMLYRLGRWLAIDGCSAGSVTRLSKGSCSSR